MVKHGFISLLKFGACSKVVAPFKCFTNKVIFVAYIMNLSDLNLLFFFFFFP